MLTEGTLKGHQALWLENDLLKITVLPSKGADIYEIIHKTSEVDFLLKTPSDLQPLGEQPPVDFLENYEGGWQELFPNHNEACEVGGKVLPFHGEVALLPWSTEVLRDDLSESAVRLQVRCQLMPFRLERVMRLRSGSSVLELEEAITNLSDNKQPYVWGQHLVLGGDFLEDGCQLEMPARMILTPEVIYEPATARLDAVQCEPWPLARGRKGELIDLQHIPGPQAHSHDDAFITGLERGYFNLVNPRLGLRFSLDWDAAIFPWVVVWQPLGGADLPPLTGIYGLGVEPWVSRYPLAQAIQEGQARWLGARERMETKLSVTVEQAT
jgi:hypothetical protein